MITLYLVGLMLRQAQHNKGFPFLVCYSYGDPLASLRCAQDDVGGIRHSSLNVSRVYSTNACVRDRRGYPAEAFVHGPLRQSSSG